MVRTVRLRYMGRVACVDAYTAVQLFWAWFERNKLNPGPKPSRAEFHYPISYSIAPTAAGQDN